MLGVVDCAETKKSCDQAVLSEDRFKFRNKHKTATLAGVLTNIGTHTYNI